MERTWQNLKVLDEKRQLAELLAKYGRDGAGAAPCNGGMSG
jgi:hypothetical protein